MSLVAGLLAASAVSGVASTTTLAALLLSYSGALSIATCTYVRIAEVTPSVTAGVRAAPALVAAVSIAVLAALPLGSPWRSAVLLPNFRCGGIAFGQLGRSVDRLTHALLRLSSPHAQRGCWGACSISFMRCCRDYRFGGAAFWRLWRSVDTSPHARRGRCCTWAPAMIYVAVAATSAAPLRAATALCRLPYVHALLRLSSHHAWCGCMCDISYERCRHGRHFGGAAFEHLQRPINCRVTRTHRCNSSFLIRGTAANVTAPSSSADHLYAMLVALLLISFGVQSRHIPASLRPSSPRVRMAAGMLRPSSQPSWLRWRSSSCGVQPHACKSLRLACSPHQLWALLAPLLLRNFWRSLNRRMQAHHRLSSHHVQVAAGVLAPLDLVADPLIATMGVLLPGSFWSSLNRINLLLLASVLERRRLWWPL